MLCRPTETACNDHGPTAPHNSPIVCVYPDGSGDLPTIQAALNASPRGTIIELADGTYAGEGNRDLDFHRAFPFLAWEMNVTGQNLVVTAVFAI
jgi:hypothetical protein